MRGLNAEVEVFCPRSSLIEWADRYFYDNRGIVSLGLPLRAIGLPTFVHVQRNVTVDFAVVSDESDPSPRVSQALRVAWKPTHGGRFPALEGMLTARSYRAHALLRFTGTYEAPLGLLGRTFDAIAGRRIARISVKKLLKDIKRYVERHDIEERADLAFASYEANLRERKAPGGAPIPLHGSVAIRRDGDYLAIAIAVDGDASDFPALLPGDYALAPDAIRRLLHDVQASRHPLDAEAEATARGGSHIASHGSTSPGELPG